MRTWAVARLISPLALACLGGPLAPALAKPAVPLDTPPTAMMLAPSRAAVAPDGRGHAEMVVLPAALAQRLLGVGKGRTLVVSGWPTARGQHRTVAFTRVEIYSSDARVVEMVGDRAVERPRSRLAFFLGAAVEEREMVVSLAVDPIAGRFAGFTLRGAEAEVLERFAQGGRDAYLVAAMDELRPRGQELSWSCGQDSAQEPLALMSPAPTLQPKTALANVSTAVVAVDTDNELMLHKFADDTTAATNYIASLFAAMNVIYERDLQMHLFEGYTILRPSTTLDPYVQPCGSSITDCLDPSAADGARLGELSAYWSGGCGGSCVGVQRASVMFLSGKQQSDFSASGIAFVDSLCSAANGYNVNQVFKFGGNTVPNDIMITAHEIGHNVGSLHTHCTGIDQCYNHEACYSGPTSCPTPATYGGIANVTGTLMSYCHLSGISGCTSSPVFHPATVAILTPKIAAKVGLCLSSLIFSDDFEAGSDSGWSSSFP